MAFAPYLRPRMANPSSGTNNVQKIVSDRRIAKRDAITISQIQMILAECKGSLRTELKYFLNALGWPAETRTFPGHDDRTLDQDRMLLDSIENGIVTNARVIEA